MDEWDENRIDVIGSNGNDGLHYPSGRPRLAFKFIVEQLIVNAEYSKKEREERQKRTAEQTASKRNSRQRSKQTDEDDDE